MKHNRSAELHSLPDQIYILDENAFFNDMRLGKKERKRLNITTTLKKSLPFSLPGTVLSVDFFKDQVGQTECLCCCVLCMMVKQMSSSFGKCKGSEQHLTGLFILICIAVSNISSRFYKNKSMMTESVTSVVV